MKIDVFDTTGKKVEEITLKKEVFGIEPNMEILNQYLRVFKMNQRQGTSSTKTRGEVSGGGIKPWKQKGTGRARVGSSRIPIWRHGGVSHGPKPHEWSLNMPKKMRRLAIISALSSLVSGNKMTVLENFNLAESKTKEVKGVVDSLKLSGKTLIVLNSSSDKAVQGAKNIKDLKTAFVGTLNAYELLNAKNVIFVKDAVVTLEGKYASK